MSAAEIELGREMSTGEANVAPDWQSWAIDCLDDEQLSHCGHLDCKILSRSCTCCQEISEHVAKHPLRALTGGVSSALDGVGQRAS